MLSMPEALGRDYVTLNGEMTARELLHKHILKVDRRALD